MTYKLALQLKNAGFPQKDRPFCVSTKMELDEKGEQVRCYIPTLSELIEACGDNENRFIRLQSYYDKNDLMWQADDNGNFIIRDDIVSETGSTPEEAVANLWLALNKK